jgi:MerR family mercuric resistance operon transcriptional regulator
VSSEACGMSEKTIGEFAKMFGVGVETIRFYQRQGILNIPQAGKERDSGNIRRYGDHDIQRLQFILSAKKAGFTLNEIKQLLECDAKNDREYIRNLSQKRILILDKKITELNEARDFLAHLVKECETTAAKECPILKAFEQT